MNEYPHFEYQTEVSSKFWEPQLKGNSLTVRFGKIGTSGQTHRKQFSTSAKAQVECRKLVCEKLAKGYKPTVKTVLVLLEKAVSAQKSEAIASLCVAEHISGEVADDLCRWLTVCIHYGMSLAQFKRVWEKFDEEDEVLCEAFSAGEYQNWYDEINGHYPYASYKIPDLYDKAVAGEADRFVWFDDNSFVSFVALRGDPGAKVIECAVVKSEGVVIVTAGSSQWPEELGPGKPIQSLGVALSPLCYGTLREGKKITNG